jgi:hypothetical protein
VIKLSATVICIGLTVSTQAQNAKIVGLGATSCATFNQEIAHTPASERDYMAWAQGFMSGALMRAPSGVDEGLDLLPPSMPLREQADFLQAYCRSHPEADYMDAAHALYRRLRGPGT